MIGGGQIYALAVPLAARCEVTEVDVDLSGEDDDAFAPVLDESWIGDRRGIGCISSSGLRYRFTQLRRVMSAHHRAGSPGGRRGAGLRRAQTRRPDHPGAPQAADFADPGAAAGFGVGGGACPLRAGVQPARARTTASAGPRRVGPAFPRLLAEYWAHEAALMAVDDWPLLRWRMRQYRHGRWGTHIVKANPQLAEDIVAAVAELGPSTAGQIEAYLEAEPRGPKGPWWGRSDTKWVAEALFAAGVLTTATRVGFARHYDLVERVLPAEVLARQVDDEDAVRELTLRAATALGIGTEADIRDYFRLSAQQVKPAIADLVAAGEIERVDVDGWSAPAYLRAGRTVPRRDRGTALLCPFDPLIFFRPRVERIFDFHYRIEIYTPAAKRQYGYYVWPLLLDGKLVARVDLKADRAADTLRVVGAFGEPDVPRPRVGDGVGRRAGVDGVVVGFGRGQRVRAGGSGRGFARAGKRAG